MKPIVYGNERASTPLAESIIDGEKEFGIPKSKINGRFIILCSDEPSKRKAISLVQGAFKGINEIEVYEYPCEEDDEIKSISDVEKFNSSKSNKLKLLIMSEFHGEDARVADLDGIFLLKGNEIQICRKIERLYKSEDTLILDFSKNRDYARNLYQLYKEMQNVIKRREYEGIGVTEKQRELTESKTITYIDFVREFIDEIDPYFDNQPWNKNFELLKKYIKLSKRNQEYFEKNGRVPIDAVIEEDGEIFQVGKWVRTQRDSFMRLYNGMTIEQITDSKSIPLKDKKKMIKLLKLGMSYARDKRSETWDDNFEMVEIYINSSPEVKEYFEATGRIDQRAVIEIAGKKEKVGRWLHYQRSDIMRIYQGMTIEQIEKDEKIPKEDKRRMRKLLELGVSYMKLKKIDEKEGTESPIVELWNENFDLVSDSINSSQEVRRYFKKNNTISVSTVVKKGDKTFFPGRWLEYQKHSIMKKYYGMTREQIQEDKSMPKEDKRRMLLLLQLGVKYPKVKQENDIKLWNENFDLVKTYINQSDENRKYFEETGNIKINAVMELENGEERLIGSWLANQKQNLMKKYQGMTVDQIKEDKTIPEEDKRRMILLLELGVHYPEEIAQIAWNRNMRLLKELLAESRADKKYFEQYGRLKIGVTVEDNEEEVNISEWLRKIRQNFMKKYQGMTIDQIKGNKDIPKDDKKKMIELLSLGVKYVNSKYNRQKSQESWDENLGYLKMYLDSSEEHKKFLEEKGYIRTDATIKVDGETKYVGKWLSNQKMKLMKMYYGMTIEEIEKSELIPEEDKRRMTELLNLGVAYPNIRDQEVLARLKESVGKWVGNNNDVRLELERKLEEPTIMLDE